MAEVTGIWERILYVDFAAAAGPSALVDLTDAAYWHEEPTGSGTWVRYIELSGARFYIGPFSGTPQQLRLDGREGTPHAGLWMEAAHSGAEFVEAGGVHVNLRELPGYDPAADYAVIWRGTMQSPGLGSGYAAMFTRDKPPDQMQGVLANVKFDNNFRRGARWRERTYTSGPASDRLLEDMSAPNEGMPVRRSGVYTSAGSPVPVDDLYTDPLEVSVCTVHTLGEVQTPSGRRAGTAHLTSTQPVMMCSPLNMEVKWGPPELVAEQAPIYEGYVNVEPLPPHEVFFVAGRTTPNYGDSGFGLSGSFGQVAIWKRPRAAVPEEPVVVLDQPVLIVLRLTPDTSAARDTATALLTAHYSGTAAGDNAFTLEDLEGYLAGQGIIADVTAIEPSSLPGPEYRYVFGNADFLATPVELPPELPPSGASATVFDLARGVAQGRIERDGKFVYELGHADRIIDLVRPGDRHVLKQVGWRASEYTGIRIRIRAPRKRAGGAGDQWVLTAACDGAPFYARLILPTGGELLLQDVVVPLPSWREDQTISIEIALILLGEG